VTPLFTLLFDCPWAISYSWSFETESLSFAFFEILGSKRIGRGHKFNRSGLRDVISSVTWPFYSL